MEFIKNYHGQIVETGFGQKVTIFDEEAYQNFVKQHYAYNHSKRTKLLLEEIPEKMIERQMNDTRYISKFVLPLLSNLVRAKENDIDTLIMGCTHYPLIRSTIRKVMGDKVNLVNPAYETAIELKNLLERDNLANKCDVDSPSSMYRFYVSDAEEKFKLFANSILPFDITMTKQINIENY